MASRDIFCKDCGKYVGTIYDAKLAKGLAYVCRTCQHPTYDIPPISSEDAKCFTDIFGDIFTKKKR